MAAYWIEVGRSQTMGALARAGFRRSARATKELLFRIRPKAAQALWPISLDRPLRRGFWVDPGHRDSVRRALDGIEGGSESALSAAREALCGLDWVFGKPVFFHPSGDFWRTDPLSGHRFGNDRQRKLKTIVRGADPKGAWELGRLGACVALGQGRWLSDLPAEREAFAERFMHRVHSFLDENPVGEGIQWASPMEAAIRAANLACALVMFRDAPQVARPTFAGKVLASLDAHARFVIAHLEDAGLVPNNHLVACLVGLGVVGRLFPELPSSCASSRVFKTGIGPAMASQVLPDGVSFEGSVPYHRLATELFTVAWLVEMGAGRSLGPAYRARLASMYRVVGAYVSDRGLAPQIGDNDSGRILPGVRRPSLEHGYLLPLGAALLGLAELKRPGAPFPAEAAWLLGDRGARLFARLVPRPSPNSFTSRLGGFHVLRGAGATLTVSAGPRGQRGMGGHNHNDRLSFEIHVHGTPVVVDSGSPCYTGDRERRDAFRGTAAHNGIEIDRREETPLFPRRPFALPDAGLCRVTEWIPEGSCGSLAACHGGYGRFRPPVFVSRRFVLDRTLAALTIADLAEGLGTHSVVARFHFPNELARPVEAGSDLVERAARAARWAGRWSPEAIAVASANGSGPVATLVFAEGARVVLEPSEYSPGYGEEVPAMCACVAREGKLPIASLAVILFH